MSYYGDFSRGDFYMSRGGWRGDPGFLSWAGKLISAVPLPGASAVGGVLSRMGGGQAAGAITHAAPGPLSGAIQKVSGAIMRHPGAAAGGGAVLAAGAGALAEHAMMGPGGAAPRGFHLCKSMRPGVKHPHPCKTGAFVRNRRMNVCNPRALRRAIRRTHGFAKLAMKAIHITHPKKKGRFGGFRKRRKK